MQKLGEWGKEKKKCFEIPGINKLDSGTVAHTVLYFFLWSNEDWYSFHGPGMYTANDFRQTKPRQFGLIFQPARPSSSLFRPRKFCGQVAC
jgi:hypothetical protein